MDKTGSGVYRLVVIDRDGPVPLYRQIAALVARDIRAGQLGLPHRIPSESELCRRFEVARGTVRRAVAQLRADGLAFTVPQRGTYVTSDPVIAEVRPEGPSTDMVVLPRLPAADRSRSRGPERST